MGKKHQNSTFHNNINNPPNNNSYYHQPPYHYPYPPPNNYMYPIQPIYMQPQYMMPPPMMMPSPGPPFNFGPPRPKRCHYHQDVRHENLETSIKKCNNGIKEIKEELKNMHEQTNNVDQETEYNDSWTNALIDYNQHHPHYFIDYLHPYLKKEHTNLDISGMNMIIKGTIKTERGNEFIDMYLYEPDLIAYILHKLKVPAYLNGITLDITLVTPAIKYMLVSTNNYPIATIDTMNIINSDTFELYFSPKEKKSINKKILDEFLQLYSDYTPPIIDKFIKKGIDVRTLKKYKKYYKNETEMKVEKDILIEETDLDDIFNKLSGIAGKMLEGKFDNLLDEVKDTIKELDAKDAEEGQNENELINLSFVEPTIKVLNDIPNANAEESIHIEELNDIEEVNVQDMKTEEVNDIEEVNDQDMKTEEVNDIEEVNDQDMKTEEIPNVIIDDVTIDTDNLSNIINNEIEENIEVMPNVTIEVDLPENKSTDEFETLDEDNIDSNDELAVLEPIDMLTEVKLNEEELHDKYNDIVLKHYTNGLRTKMDKKFLLIYSD